ncbi:nucleoside kinase [Agathobacter ruminis]|uniref:Nucleoside kinase n=1 Tax=Agathobacter ruminis TaxID=1712665 RepID=A0A2G3E3I1_9FIRM|nr:nucleoside kinase [Agathobacter ruminis]MDC7300203.1 nucleoside kinase [Agathobacter ruminis]PHU37828.1 nucleoside kinase [Agathobacter ruminis]
MQEYQIKLYLPDDTCVQVSAPAGMTLEDLYLQHKDAYDAPVMLAQVGHKLRELNKEIKADGEVRFVTMLHPDGRRTYRRSMTMLLQKALDNVYRTVADTTTHVKVMYSLGQGYYCEFIGENRRILSQEELNRVKEEMRCIVDADCPIKKVSYKSEQAEEIFKGLGLNEKERLLHYRRSSRVNLYELNGMLDYFYGYMVPSTRYLKWFDLEAYEDGFVLLFPDKIYNEVKPLETSNKLHNTLHASREWSNKLNISSIGALNDVIAQGRAQKLILTHEALMEQRIGNLAQTIVDHPEVKFVMIAGPSSSGKTSFANRLAIQLLAKGTRPHPVSLDDYYVDRDKCPRNPDGSFDFECLESIDVPKFNEDMSTLLNGGEIKMPSFNFKTGKREYRGETLKLTENDILVIEGIHGLNDKLSYSLPDECKFRIYISALTQLNVDEHNPLPTTDGRLIRRIVRDARTRGTNAQETIAMWPSVRAGEEKYIFPFQDSADVIFNSALLYELPVLKVFAEPLLFQIPREAPEYSEAKRLLKFLDYFLPMPDNDVPQNSLVREFVGGSVFHV